MTAHLSATLYFLSVFALAASIIVMSLREAIRRVRS